MSSLLARIFGTPAAEQRSLYDILGWFTYNGNVYPYGINQTLRGTKEEIGGDFSGLTVGAFKANAIIFAAMQARASLFSEARFQWRQLRSGRPGDLFGTPALNILERPWSGATTGDFLARAIGDLDLAGNSFWLRRRNRLIRLRPDWTFFVHGSVNDPEVGMWDTDAELLGYGYQPGGPAESRKVEIYDPSEVCHFAGVTPDPLAPHRGVSWLISLIREIEADNAATSHKLNFFVNGATPNLVVTGVPSQSQQAFKDWVDAFEGKHKGTTNAYKSLYLSPAMDAKVVGNSLEQVDFKAVQGAGEVRIAAAAGVPAAVLGISEGLAGSALNAGNYTAAFRRFADLTIRPLWRNLCGSLEVIVPPPGGAELWYDDRDVPALKDDVLSAAEVQAKNAQMVRTLVDGGFTPESVIEAVTAGDFKRLEHTGLYSVQLQPPKPEQEPEPEPELLLPEGAKPPLQIPANAGRSELLQYLLARVPTEQRPFDRADDEDDHFYGAWSGGKKSEGGHPAAGEAGNSKSAIPGPFLPLFEADVLAFHSKVEWGQAFDKDGHPIGSSKSGTAHSVGIFESREELEQARGGSLSHLHPTEEGEREDFISLSSEDVQLHLREGLAVTRAFNSAGHWIELRSTEPAGVAEPLRAANFKRRFGIRFGKYRLEYQRVSTRLSYAKAANMWNDAYLKALTETVRDDFKGLEIVTGKP